MPDDAKHTNEEGKRGELRYTIEEASTLGLGLFSVGLQAVRLFKWRLGVGRRGCAVELENGSIDSELEGQCSCLGITTVASDLDFGESRIETKSIIDAALSGDVVELDGTKAWTEPVPRLWTRKAELFTISNLPDQRALSRLQGAYHIVHNLKGGESAAISRGSSVEPVDRLGEVVRKTSNRDWRAEAEIIGDAKEALGLAKKDIIGDRDDQTSQEIDEPV